MNVVPHMKIFCPADDVATKKILRKCIKINGPKYVRLGRSEVPYIYNEESEFEIGKSNMFGVGKDGTIFSVGQTVSIALQAKELLKQKGIDVRVVDLYSIKPIDKDRIVDCAKETDLLLSIEDHNVIGGIGSIISNVLTEYYPKKLIKLGVQDVFGKSGNPEKLYEKYGISVGEIVKIFEK